MIDRASDWILSTEADGYIRHFAEPALPVSIGGAISDDVQLTGVSGSLQIGVLDGVFFVQPTRDTRNVRIDGEHVSGSRRLADGAVIALDNARLRCRLSNGRLSVAIEGRVTAGDTVPPDLEELAKEAREADEIEIVPIAFTPKRAGEAERARSGPSLGALAVMGAFAFLAVLGWFAFTAKSVELRIDPLPQEVRLPGTLFKLRIGDRYLLRSGSHRIVAELPGYYPLEAEIAVTQAPDQTIELAMTKLPGRITLTTEPEVPAQVSVDGDPLGVTPLQDVEIPPGLHRVEFRAQRYLAEVRELQVEGGGERQTLSVTLVPNWAPVSLATEPAGAEVWVDGTSVGVTPLEMELEAGERQIEARLAGYNAWRHTIRVNADQPQQLPPVTLTPADGRVTLVTQPGEAAVSVNDQFRGRTPITLELAPGRTHVIRVTKPGYETVTRELTVEADSGRRLEIELEAQLGVVQVQSDPPGAEVWIDGRVRGNTPAELSLMAVAHDIEVRLDGFASHSAQITPRPGYPQVLDVTLEPLDAVSGSGYQQTLHTSLGQELKLITPGSFTMGSSRREQGRRSNEVLRPVKLTRAYYLGVHEVTNAQFRAFDPEHDSGSFAGVSLNDDDQPVVRVTWEEVAAYLNWLSIKDGLQPVYEERQGTWVPVRPLRNGYRLPTEAEWAWAARFAEQESPLIYPWGQELPPPDRSGNYADLSAGSILPTTLVTYNDGFPVSAPPGSFAPNAVGIHDLGGNVAEWVQDFYAIETSASPPLLTDPLGPESGRFRVIRGPSWRSATVTDLRLAYRHYGADGREDLGFRLARNLE